VTSQAIGRVGIEYDQLPPAALDQLDGVLPELVEEVHHTGHSLRVWALSLGGCEELSRLIARESTTRPAGALSA
jgi:hypothetical protein